ncbi:xylulokinase [Membranihabitans marinus]|uniref:xylulokinase n=1 Tax=Membranihabitans marinus TaxID=1227546 RepID=UPI001EFF4CDA|nr:FGGY family carbohydrate kinase [Membranihabitans marinus]
MYLLGYDIGSSSIKAALVEADTGRTILTVQAPNTEMKIDVPEKNHAEQDPSTWWKYIVEATQKLLTQYPGARDQIIGIGIAYQMHGLVLIDEDKEVIRPSIIWCDSRAVEIGHGVESKLGKETLMNAYYNLPGNFTFSKLLWVKENEADNYNKIWKILLPGDYIALKLTDQVSTSISGLSEAILWNFKENTPAYEILKAYDIPPSFLPEHHGSFHNSGLLTETAARELGLSPGIPVGYRAGDQPNNAFSLNVSEIGVLAATGGTSGVLYGISDQAVLDIEQRTNSFAHVNYSTDHPSIGTLLCINGAGIVYSWIREQIVGVSNSYFELESRAEKIPAGSDGLLTLPFGNGAERIFQNRQIGSHILGIDLNTHSQDHMIRSALEGIAFAFVYSIEIMQSLGIQTKIIKTGNDNLFQSKIFSETIAQLAQIKIVVVEATGAVGAAIGAGLGIGHYKDIDQAFQQQKPLREYLPSNAEPSLEESYKQWKKSLIDQLNTK